MANLDINHLEDLHSNDILLVEKAQFDADLGKQMLKTKDEELIHATAQLTENACIQDEECRRFKAQTADYANVAI